MTEKSLKKKASSSIVWTAGQKYSGMIVQFVSGVILARILTPENYGCIGMLSVFISLAETTIDGGFGSALIQKKNPSQQDYSTIFWWNMMLATILYGVLFFAAPAIARFYDIPILCKVLRVQGIILFLYAFNIVQHNQLRKQLKFKILSIISVTTSIVSFIATLVVAYVVVIVHGNQEGGVWALVVHHIVAALIPAVFYWFYVRWRPLLTFSKQSFKELFSFGLYIFLTHLTNKFAAKLNVLMIGRLYSSATLGYVSKGIRLEQLVSHSISSTLTQVTYPLYAQVQDDKARLVNMVKRLTAAIAVLTFPLLGLLILDAKPLIVLLYSDRWLQSVPFFQFFCLIGLSECLQAVNTQTIAAIGKSRLMFQWTLIKRTVGMVFMIGGLVWFGLWGFMVGAVLYNWSAYFVNIGLVSKNIGYSWQRQLRDLSPMFFVTLIAVGASYGISSFCGLSLYLDGIVRGAVFVIIYGLWILIRKPESFTYLLDIMPAKYRFWEKLPFFRKK